MTGIGERLKQLRTEKNLTMDALVANMQELYGLPKLSKSLLSRWERGENEPSLEYAKHLAMYFNVSLDYLIGLTDDRTPSATLARLSAYYNAMRKIMEDGK